MPEIKDRSVCETCGEPIEYLDRYDSGEPDWYHLTDDWSHPPAPEPLKHEPEDYRVQTGSGWAEPPDDGT